jgi:hypothetical protein
VEAQSTIEAGKGILELFNRLYNPLRRQLEKKALFFSGKTRELQEDLFFPLFWDDISSDVGSAHPSYPYGIHPGNLVAAEEISRSLVSIYTRWKLKPFGKIRVPKQDNNMILVGGPASTLFTRIAMGYDIYDVTKEPKTNLRYVFNLNSKKQYICKMIVEGETLEEPEYPIIDRDKGKMYGSQCDDDSYLVEDFLLITVMPNILTERRKTIVNISGCHDIGTRAFVLVLRDREILEKIKEKRDSRTPTRSFQSLIRVSKIARKKKYFEPLKVTHIDTFPLYTTAY